MLPSGSLLPVPSSVTRPPEFTDCAAPAFAAGGVFPLGLTEMFTVEAALAAPRLSVTTRENVSVVATAALGAVNVGWATVVLESVTALPAVCVQAYEAMLPSGSLLAEPFSMTVAPELMLCAAPALAVGGVLVVPPPLLLPPGPLLHAQSRKAAKPASAKPCVRERMASYTPPWQAWIVRIVTYGCRPEQGFPESRTFPRLRCLLSETG